MKKLLFIFTLTLFAGSVSAQSFSKNPETRVSNTKKVKTKKTIALDLPILEKVNEEDAATIYAEIQETVKNYAQIIQRDAKEDEIIKHYRISSPSPSGKISKPGKVTKQEVIYDTKLKTFVDESPDKSYKGILEVDGIKFKVLHKEKK